MPSYTITEGLQYLSDVLSYAITKSADNAQQSGAISVANGQTAFLINWAIDVSEADVIFIVSDQNVTLKTNSSGSPDNTINLLANQPLVWYSGSYYTNLLTVDVTAFYVANASGSAATLYIYTLQDPTP